jgi:hypothetical protein
MTQYLLSVYQPDGPVPGPEVIEPIARGVDEVNRDLRAAGAWVFSGGLHAPETATVLHAKDGEVVVTDGPYTEGKEHLGGFTIIDVPDLDAALRWADRLAKIIMLPIEVRPFQEGLHE